MKKKGGVDMKLKREKCYGFEKGQQQALCKNTIFKSNF